MCLKQFYGAFVAAGEANPPHDLVPGGIHHRLEDVQNEAHRTVALFVRNPWDRLVSLSYFLGGVSGPLPMHDFLDQVEVHAGETSIYLEPSARSWWTPEVDFIGRFEHLERDWRDLLTRLWHPPIELGHEHRSSTISKYLDGSLHVQARSRDWRPYYERPSDVDRVARLCSWEIEQFGYRFDDGARLGACSPKPETARSRPICRTPEGGARQCHATRDTRRESSRSIDRLAAIQRCRERGGPRSRRACTGRVRSVAPRKTTAATRRVSCASRRRTRSRSCRPTRGSRAQPATRRGIARSEAEAVKKKKRRPKKKPRRY